MLRVATIGGGPAASALAATLMRLAPRGRAGVTVLEARCFPRGKVCGEFISPAATGVLESLIDRGALRAAGARRVDRLVLESDDSRVAWPLPAPAWTLSRKTLDALLLRAAERAGAGVRQPAPVRGVDYHDRSVVLNLDEGRTLEADVVIHADGSGRFDPAGATPCRPGVLGVKCFIRPAQAIDGLHMRAARGAYVGTVGVEDGLATLALVAGAGLLRAASGNIDRMVRALWPGYRAEWREGDWLTCGVPDSRYIRPGHRRSFRIGNAAGAVEPVGGEGIGLALWSGCRLGELLAAVAAGPEERIEEGLASVQARLGAEYRRRLRARRPACRLAGGVLMNRGLTRAVWPLLRAPGLSLRPCYRLTGKPARAASTCQPDHPGEHERAGEDEGRADPGEPPRTAVFTGEAFDLMGSPGDHRQSPQHL